MWRGVIKIFKVNTINTFADMLGKEGEKEESTGGYISYSTTVQKPQLVF
jgi:hypothetical protein